MYPVCFLPPRARSRSPHDHMGTRQRGNSAHCSDVHSSVFRR
uniref:Uncharacterized protein n=1 Tax=Siphoviridae sp. ctFmt20 TaxID=2826214 RepID=A0A8S5NCJ0_9CAUD|nr:MAG TPA: hypothetical protein [Siphoviridae sp. ctFmt20]